MIAIRSAAEPAEPEGGLAAINITNRTGRLPACVATALALLSLVLVAGCGSGSAHTNSSAKVVSGALAYADCMRSHGVPDFPDPNGQGDFQLRPATRVVDGRRTAVGDLIPTSPAFQGAQRACGSFGSAGRRVTVAQENQEFRSELTAARCMRANGVSGYPDPKLVGGSIDLEFNGRFSPTSPAFQRAAAKCGKAGVPLAGTLPAG